MESLKNFLRKRITGTISDLEKMIPKYKISLDDLSKTNLERANYEVSLSSMWESDGEKSTKTEYRGTLKDAIKATELEFKSTNGRSDVQADYFVKVKLGNILVPVSEEYWNDFKEKRDK